MGLEKQTRMASFDNIDDCPTLHVAVTFLKSRYSLVYAHAPALHEHVASVITLK